MKKTAVNVVKLLGFLFVVIATFLSTVRIPAIDRKVSEREKAIDKFNYSRIMVGICKLDYGEHFTQRRIDLFEANQMVGISKEKQGVKKLRERVLKNTAELARCWASFWGGEDASATLENTNANLDKILSDESMTVEAKITEVEKLWTDNQDKASSRLRDAHKKFKSNKRVKKDLEDERLFWFRFFIWLQISGLILFSGAEIIGDLIKFNGKRETED